MGVTEVSRDVGQRERVNGLCLTANSVALPHLGGGKRRLFVILHLRFPGTGHCTEDCTEDGNIFE